MNQTLSQPQLSVTVDYETPAVKGEAEEDEDNYEAEVEEQFLSLDSYNIHLPKFHPQVNTNLETRWIFNPWIKEKINFKTKTEKSQLSSYILFCTFPEQI